MLEQRARERPDGLALDDLARRRRWAALWDRVSRLARLLREDLGLRPGDHAAALLANRVESIERMHAALRAGIWLTPVTWHLSPEEIDYVLEDSGARVVFTDATHRELASRGPGTVLEVGDELDRALASASDAPMDPSGPAGGPMIYTSGTTGRPKGVKRWHPASLADTLLAQRAGARPLGLDGVGAHLVTGPCYHAAPLMFAVYDQAAGAPVVVMPRWDAERALELLVEREIAKTHLAPDVFTIGDIGPCVTKDPARSGRPCPCASGVFVSRDKPSKPAVEGWFDMDEKSPRLVGTRCADCGSVYFPAERSWCRNPRCAGSDLPEVRLSPRGRLWSFTNNCYPPPPPYIAPDPFVPYAIAAVELEAEKMVVLGQVAGAAVEDLEAGMEMEIVLDTLYEDDEARYLIWKWRPVAA